MFTWTANVNKWEIVGVECTELDAFRQELFINEKMQSEYAQFLSGIFGQQMCISKLQPEYTQFLMGVFGQQIFINNFYLYVFGQQMCINENCIPNTSNSDYMSKLQRKERAQKPTVKTYRKTNHI